MIVDDEHVEGTEQFEISWLSESPRVTFNPSVFLLTIEDNDGKLYNFLYCDDVCNNMVGRVNCAEHTR